MASLLISIEFVFIARQHAVHAQRDILSANLLCLSVRPSHPGIVREHIVKLFQLPSFFSALAYRRYQISTELHQRRR